MNRMRTVKSRFTLMLMALMVVIIFAMPENVSAAEKRVTVGDFVMTTTNVNGLTEKDYLAEKHKDGYWTLHIFTSKPIEVKMRDGLKKTDDRIKVEKKKGISKVDLTINKLVFKTVEYAQPIQILNEYEDKFEVDLTIKGLNVFQNKTGGISADNCRLNIKGGKIEASGCISGSNANLYITDTKLNFTTGDGGIDVFTYTNKPLYKADAKLKNVTFNRAKVGNQALRADGMLTIENSTVKTKANRGSAGIVGRSGLIIKNSTIHTDCTTDGLFVYKGILQITDSIVRLNTNLDDLSYVGDADEEFGIQVLYGDIKIKRSNVNVLSESNSDGKYGIYGKKVQLIDSIVNVKEYQKGIRAKKQGLFIDSSNVRVEARDKAIMVGSQNGIAKKKLSLSGCTLKNGVKKGYYNGKYVVVRTKNGGVAKRVTIKMTKPGKPLLTLSNVADTGKIKLSWTTTPMDTKYQVFRAVKKNGKYTRIATIDKVKTTKKATYVDTKAKTGRTYYYKVRTIAGEKKSAYSAIKSRACK